MREGEREGRGEKNKGGERKEVVEEGIRNVGEVERKGERTANKK